MKVLAIDIGTSSVKVLLVSAKGEVVASAASPVTSRSPPPGFLEESPDDWWEALRSALVSLRANMSTSP